jgi:hypothetical protein
MLALCTVVEPNAFASPRSPLCETGLRAVLGNLLQVSLPTTLHALPFSQSTPCPFPLTVALSPSWPAVVASVPVRSQTRTPRELKHA